MKISDSKIHHPDHLVLLICGRIVLILRLTGLTGLVNLHVNYFDSLYVV